MARKTSRLVMCDFPHDNEVFDGTKPTTFVLDGRTYEIDLCSAHTMELSDEIGRYAHHARRVRLNGLSPKAGSKQGRERSADIRRWARTLGIEIKDRGR